jgi:hypothetical protein
LVVFPARYISSISPRVYFRKHAFCFLSSCHLRIPIMMKVLKFLFNISTYTWERFLAERK